MRSAWRTPTSSPTSCTASAGPTMASGTSVGSGSICGPPTKSDPYRRAGSRRLMSRHCGNSTTGNSAATSALPATARLRQAEARGEVGKGLYAWSYAHTVRFDKDDSLWAVDKGSDMIVRFNPQDRVTMVFGRKKEASDKAEPWERVTPPRAPVPGQFRQPTDVAWDTEGNIYISDGYINSRVAKFTRDGDWVTSMGEAGGGKLGNLNTPHTIANDSKGNIYVGDRGNRRIQVIDPKTNQFVREIKIDVPAPADAMPWMGAKPDVARLLAADAPPGSATMAPGAPWAICVTDRKSVV